MLHVHNVYFIVLLVLILILEIIHLTYFEIYSICWLPIYAAKIDHEFMILMTLLPKCWDHRCVLQLSLGIIFWLLKMFILV